MTDDDPLPSAPMTVIPDKTHSPIPYHASYNSRLGKWRICHAGLWEERGDNWIASILTSLDPELDEANANFIVKACNYHQVMIDAAETLLAACAGVSFSSQQQAETFYAAEKKLLEIIPLD